MNGTFKKRFDGPRLSRDEAARQGRISHLAFTTLGQVKAIAFLNSHHDQLGGRPLELAIASSEGLAAVERALELPQHQGD